MKNTNLVYGVNDKPGLWKTFVFALQQVLAVLAATIAVPAIIGNGMSQSAALFGAGVGTIIYLLFTKFNSPVFLGSSFAFISSMFAAFSGAGAYLSLGYLGLIIGAVFAGLVYVVIAIIIKYAGVNWIDKIMPASVIGPTVAVIGLSLSANAIKDAVMRMAQNPDNSNAYIMNVTGFIGLFCALVTLLTVVICSVYGKKMMKMIPFIIGIGAGYLTATIFTIIGTIADVPELIIINFSLFKEMKWLPEFTFIEAFKGLSVENFNWGAFIASLAVAYVPVAFVVFAEHLADHKNISSIIGKDLTKDPGLHRTLLGDGIGSMFGAFFGGCPNTTYGESVGCVAISGNASIVTILTAAITCIVASFLAPFVTLLATIPACVMGGVCISLYGFIAVSGLKMIQKVNLNENRNLFTVSVILIAGVGGMALEIGKITLTAVACALILGIIVNLITSKVEKEDGNCECKDAEVVCEEQKAE